MCTQWFSLGHTSHCQLTYFIHLRGDIRRRICSRPGRYSTSGPFPTPTSCEACELRKTVPLRQCDPICAVQHRVRTTAWRDPICAANALRTFATVPRVSENISRLPILGCLFVPAPACCTDATVPTQIFEVVLCACLQACAGASWRRFAQSTQACALHVMAKND